MTAAFDVLAPGLKVVLWLSAEVVAPDAGFADRFWSVIHEIGLTPHRLRPDEFRRLPEYGIGLVTMSAPPDPAEEPHATGEEVTGDERAAFLARVLEFQPRAIALVGARAARGLLGLSGQGTIDFGFHPCDDVGGSKVFVLPSTSLSARHLWEPSYWQAFGDFVRSLKDV